MKQTIPEYAKPLAMAHRAIDLYQADPGRRTVTICDMFPESTPLIVAARLMLETNLGAIIRHLDKNGISVCTVNERGASKWAEVACDEEHEAMKCCPFVCSGGGPAVAVRRGFDTITAVAHNKQRDVHTAKELKLRRKYQESKKAGLLEAGALDTLRLKPSSRLVKLLGGSTKTKGTVIYSNTPRLQR